ncbi:MAG: cytochrome c3 family protein [Acidobacteriota bacterium]
MIAWLLAAAIAPADAACMTCHPAERVQLEKSVHFRDGIGCETCHGGDPGALDVKRAHGEKYLGVPARREIPRHCASCHSDPLRMKPHNLPIDQFALYQISGHGRRLAEGDERVAVCTDCHGAHDIRSARDPESPTYSSNVPETCGSCHADEELMMPYGLSAGIPADYNGSAHGKSLMEEGNLSAPNCAHCHGVHGAAPPGFGDVDKVCGRCHASAREFFADSVHKEAMDAAGLPECASCHGNHAIAPAGSELARRICQECHDANSAAGKVGLRLLALESAAVEEVEQAARRIEEAEQVPLDVEDYRARLELARTHLQEVYPAMHSVDLDQVSPHAVSARSEAEDIEKEIYEKRSDMRIRRLGLAVFWFYVLLTVVVLVGLRRQSGRD